MTSMTVRKRSKLIYDLCQIWSIVNSQINCTLQKIRLAKKKKKREENKRKKKKTPPKKIVSDKLSYRKDFLSHLLKTGNYLVITKLSWAVRYAGWNTVIQWDGSSLRKAEMRGLIPLWTKKRQKSHYFICPSKCLFPS